MRIAKTRFSADCTNKVFSIDAADLGTVPESLTLVSDMGCEATFSKSSCQRDEDGDVLIWKYRPTSESLAAIPRLEGWSITVFND